MGLFGCELPTAPTQKNSGSAPALEHAADVGQHQAAALLPLFWSGPRARAFRARDLAGRVPSHPPARAARLEAMLDLTTR